MIYKPLVLLSQMSQGFYDKLDEYYRLKSDYLTERDDILKKIIGAANKGGAGAAIDVRAQWSSSKKPKCVGCRRPVGTIFTTEYDKKNDERILGAKCGDAVDPCPLKITLAMGDIRPLPQFIEEEEGNLKAARKRVIELKNKLLMGAISESEVMEAFKELQEDINTSNQLFEYYLTRYDGIVHSYNNKQRLEKVAAEKFAIKEDMRRAMSAYESTHNEAFVQDAVEIYVGQFKPLVTADLGDKYARCEVVSEIRVKKPKSKSTHYGDGADDVDEGRGAKPVELPTAKLVYCLRQEEVTPDMIEYTLLEPRVVAFNLGGGPLVAKPKKAKNSGGGTDKQIKLLDSGINFAELVDDEL